jgi:cobyrinic acid a,c-diamide synthase
LLLFLQKKKIFSCIFAIMTTRGLIIAAPSSGAGKTTLTLALLVALARRGVRVRAAKAGPDYIDPAFHAAASGHPALNLDGWAMPPALLDGLLAEAGDGADLLVIESAMGLFDGAGGAHRGSGADLAARFGLPVILVQDVTGQAQSAAAVAVGFAGFDAGVTLAGVILNRVASARHRDLILPALAAAGIAAFGAFPREAGIALPARHLGLVQAGEHPALDRLLAALADAAEAHLDLPAIIAAARPLPRAAHPFPAAAPPALPPPGQRIALAEDRAFSFVYPHLLAAWRRQGGEILPFSPLADEAPAADADACWLPGGYPELHAGALATAARFRAGMARFAETRPIHGECGGYMVLGTGLEDQDGVRHPMLGLLGHATSLARRRLTLGYRRAVLAASGPLGAAGRWLRGHEFHYASVTDPGRDLPLATLFDANGHPLGPAGGRRGWVSGGFFHVIAQEETP